MKSKTGLGIFVRKDVNGNDIHVGDVVRVTRPEMRWKSEGVSFHHEQITWEGEVRLLLSVGIRVAVDGFYLRAPITDSSLNKWMWELVESYNVKHKEA